MREYEKHASEKGWEIETFYFVLQQIRNFQISVNTLIFLPMIKPHCQYLAFTKKKNCCTFLKDRSIVPKCCKVLRKTYQPRYVRIPQTRIVFRAIFRPVRSLDLCWTTFRISDAPMSVTWSCAVVSVVSDKRPLNGNRRRRKKADEVV